MQEISRTIIAATTDSPLVYRMAVEAARTAGLPRHDQVKFAGRVVDLLFISHSAKGVLVFSTGSNDHQEAVLRASLENTPLLIETIIPALPASPSPASEDFVSDYELMHQRHMDLEQRIRDMQQFTFSISHELKNSITKLKLSTALLENESDPAMAGRHILVVKRASAQLEATLMGLNEIIELRHSTPIARPVSFREIFDQVYEELEEKISAAGASIDTDFDGIDNWLYVGIYLKSIFSNLLVNALKYRVANRKPEIVIRAVKQDNDVLLSFSDNGQGIDLERHGRNLFLPFSRFSTNKQEGKGLGLYIIKNMIERNGGRIEAESEPDQGIRFRMLLRSY